MTEVIPPRLILLPGLHGTGELFTPLLPFIQPELRPKVVAYPTNAHLGYGDLLDLIEHELQNEPDLVVLAESFSGPLAIRYAARHPDQVRALVLSGTFIRSPLWGPMVWMFNGLVWSRPPKTVLRWLVLGRDAPRPICRWVQKAIARVDPKVFACRLREVQRLDAADDLARCQCPILCLQARDDAIVKPTNVARMLAVQPGIATRTLNGPHMLLQRFPAEAWRCIAEFLEQISPPARDGQPVSRFVTT